MRRKRKTIPSAEPISRNANGIVVGTHVAANQCACSSTHATPVSAASGSAYPTAATPQATAAGQTVRRAAVTTPHRTAIAPQSGSASQPING